MNTAAVQEAVVQKDIAHQDKMCAISLSHLEAMSPSRLKKLLAIGAPSLVWERLVEGSLASALVEAGVAGIAGAGDVVETWCARARGFDQQALLARYEDAGVEVWFEGGHLPGRFLGDPWSPGVVFYRGRGAVLEQPTVGIVGTRSCTPEGRRIAFEFGAELTRAGIGVVSGLALGIDGSAHRGALAQEDARPIGVVGSGLDVVYPRAHGQLWRDVANAGLLLSETPLGLPPEQWRFPARNRIIAALSDVVVVVESNEKGGSLSTAREAANRNVAVLAVPGSIRSRASVGTNELLRDGCAPACSTRDIIEALPPHLQFASEFTAGARDDSGSRPHPDDLGVLRAVGRRFTSTEEVLDIVGCSLGEASVSLLRLEAGGWIVGGQGWWQRVDDEVRVGRPIST